MKIKGWLTVTNEQSQINDLFIYNKLNDSNIVYPKEVVARSFYYFFFKEDTINNKMFYSIYTTLKLKLQSYQIMPDLQKTAYIFEEQKRLEKKFKVAKDDYDKHQEELDEYYNEIDEIECIIKKINPKYTKKIKLSECLVYKLSYFF
jgi:hypothetical protein